MYTHTCMHACMHTHTVTHRYTYTHKCEEGRKKRKTERKGRKKRRKEERKGSRRGWEGRDGVEETFQLPSVLLSKGWIQYPQHREVTRIQSHSSGSMTGCLRGHHSEDARYVNIKEGACWAEGVSRARAGICAEWASYSPGTRAQGCRNDEIKAMEAFGKRRDVPQTQFQRVLLVALCKGNLREQEQEGDASECYRSCPKTINEISAFDSEPG